MKTIEELKLFGSAKAEITENLQAARDESSTTYNKGLLGTLTISRDPSNYKHYWLFKLSGIREIVYGYLFGLKDRIPGHYEIDVEEIIEGVTKLEVKYYNVTASQEDEFGIQLVTDFMSTQSYNNAISGLIKLLKMENFDEYEIRTMLSALSAL